MIIWNVTLNDFKFVTIIITDNKAKCVSWQLTCPLRSQEKVSGCELAQRTEEVGRSMFNKDHRKRDKIRTERFHFKVLRLRSSPICRNQHFIAKVPGSSPGGSREFKVGMVLVRKNLFIQRYKTRLGRNSTVGNLGGEKDAE